MQTYQCPNGHTVTADNRANVVCEPCNLIAVQLNRKAGTVGAWTDIDCHRDAVESLNDQLDAAFDNQYFGGGW